MHLGVAPHANHARAAVVFQQAVEPLDRRTSVEPATTILIHDRSVDIQPGEGISPALPAPPSRPCAGSSDQLSVRGPTKGLRVNLRRVIGAVHQVIAVPHPVTREPQQRDGSLAVMRRRPRGERRHRHPVTGLRHMELIAGPVLLIPLTVALAPHAAHPGQFLQHLVQRLFPLALEDRRLRRGTLLAIAKLGGFIGRTRDGSPGAETFWRGLRQVYDVVTALTNQQFLAEARCVTMRVETSPTQRLNLPSQVSAESGKLTCPNSTVLKCREGMGGGGANIKSVLCPRITAISS